MRKLLWKYVAMLLVVASLTTAICFRHAIVRFGIAALFNHYAPRPGGWSVSYDKVDLKKKGAFFSDLHLYAKDGLVDCKIPSLEVTFKLRKHLHVDMALTALHPECTLVKSAESALSFTLEDLSIPIYIEKGSLKLKEKETETTVYFSLIGDEKRRSPGTLYISHLADIETTRHVMMKWFFWPEETIVEMELEDANLPWMAKVHQFFEREEAVSWDVREGTLSGHFWIGWKEEGGVSQANAVMHIDHARAIHEENGLEAEVEELALDFSYPGGKKPAADEIWWQNIALKSQVVGGKVGFKDVRTEMEFALCDLSGNVQLSTFKDSEILLRGYLDRKGLISPILLSGYPSVVNRDTLDFDLKLLLEPECKESTRLNLSIAMEDGSDWIVRGKLREMGIEQIAMFQHIIALSHPEVKDFELGQGTITCELSLRMHEGSIDRLLLDNLEADHLQVYWASRDILGFCAHLEGSAQLDFNSLPALQFPAWDITLKGGDIVMGQHQGTSIGISDINMQLVMCRGVFEPSWVKAIYQGVEARVDIVGYYPEADIKVHFASTVDRLLSFVTDAKEELDLFSEHKAYADIELHRQLGYWDVIGAVKLDVGGHWEDKGKFGFSLSDRIYKTYSEQLQKETPFIELLGKSISKGWFKIEEASTEFIRYLQVSHKLPWRLEGIASFEGVFDGETVDLDLEASHLQFFSEALDVKMHGEEDKIESSRGHLHYNMIKGSWEGFLPLYHAEIHEKNKGFLFQNVRGECVLEGDSIRLEGVNLQSDGIIMEGDVEIKLTDKGPLLKVIAHRFSGTIRQLEKFLTHIEEISFPLKGIEGNILNKERGLELVLDFTKEEPQLEWTLDLRVVHGTYHLPRDLVLQDLSFDLDIDSKEGRAILSNVSGRSKEGGYLINGRYVDFNYITSYLMFDMRLENETMDLIRLKGDYDLHTEVIGLDLAGSEYLGRHFETCDLKLNHEGNVTEAAVAFEISLKELITLMEITSDLGLIESREFLSRYLDYEGLLVGKLSYKGDTLEVELAGKDLSLWDTHCQNAKISLKKEGDTWTVGPCKWDDLTFSAKIMNEEGGYAISECSLDTPDLKVVFEKGFYDFAKGSVILPIQEAKGKVPLLSHGIGEIAVQGEIELSLSDFKVLLGGNITLLGKTKEGKPFVLTSEKKATLEYTAEHGLIVKDSLFFLEGEDLSIHLDVPTLAYHFTEHLCQGYRIKASLSKDAMAKLSKWVDGAMEKDVPTSASGDTHVVFDFEMAEDKFQVGGVFDKGEYLFRDKAYAIDGCSFHYDEKHLDVYLAVSILEKPFGINFRMQPFDAFDTTIEAFLLEEGAIQKPRALFIEAKLKGPDGVSVQKVEGDLFGFDFSFLPQPRMGDDVSLVFLGGVKIDVDGLLPLLEGKTKEFIEALKFHKGCELKGEITLVKGNLGASFFEGYLSGRDFDMLGYQFKTLLASVHINKDGFSMQNCKFSDDAVTADMGQMRIYAAETGAWMMEIPELRITDLRPSLLRKRFDGYQRLKPFRIKNMLFQDIVGDLSDENTFTGRGHLSFVNTFKQGHNLLDVPIEIISRLGLDMVLLVPIQGEMDYVIRNGKIVFTKLKNSFSESKRSYFYLWNKSESYVDFSGNMHIDIRMKQYVLFKITELFVLSVRGDLEQPKFSLR